MTIIAMYDRVRLLHDVQDGDTTIPAGTIGVVVDILGQGSHVTVDFHNLERFPTVSADDVEIVEQGPAPTASHKSKIGK